MGKYDVGRYCREVAHWLPCSLKLKKRVLTELKESVLNFICDYPNACYTDIVERFGTPQQVAITYVDEMATGELLADLMLKNKIRTIVLATAAVVVCLWMGTVTAALIESTVDSDGYHEVIVVDDEHVDK